MSDVLEHCELTYVAKRELGKYGITAPRRIGRRGYFRIKVRLKSVKPMNLPGCVDIVSARPMGPRMPGRYWTEQSGWIYDRY